MSIREHPAVMAASFDVDVASTNIRVAEGSAAAERQPAGQRQPQP